MGLARVIWLYGPNGGNYLRRQYGDRKEFLVYDVNAGIYTLVVGPYYRNIPGASYTLDIAGSLGSVTQIESQSAMMTGSWTNGGGRNDPDAPGNDVYTFEVTENNSTVDLILESSDVDVCLWLYPPLGGSNWLDREYGDRQEFIVYGVNKGTYRVIAGTNDVGAIGNYKLSLVGEFTNFQKE